MKKIIDRVIVSALSFLPFFVFASGVSNSGLANPIGVSSITDLIAKILSAVAAFGAVLVVLAIIYSGFLFVTAQGNVDEIKKAKSIFLWTVVGAVVLLGAETLSRIILQTARDVGVKGI